MPKRQVTVKRWQVVGAFLAILAVGILGDVRGDRRTDAAEERIRENAVSIEQLEDTNRQIAEQRQALVEERVRADLRICREVESIKDRIRASVTFNEQRFNDTLESLGIKLGSPQAQALLKSARESEAELRERFKPLNCRVLTKP